MHRLTISSITYPTTIFLIFFSHIFSDDIQYPSDYFRQPRRSMDHAYSRFGLSLIELCCTAGHFTCIANQSASIVDYMLCSSELFNNISNFTVLDNDDSDHFPIACSIILQTEAENSVAYGHKMKCELFL